MEIFCRLIQKGAVVIIVVSGFAGPMFNKFACDVGTILPLNIFFSRNYHIPIRFGTSACRIKVICQFLQTLVVMATSEQSEK